jgi:endonuclease-3
MALVAELDGLRRGARSASRLPAGFDGAPSESLPRAAAPARQAERVTFILERLQELYPSRRFPWITATPSRCWSPCCSAPSARMSASTRSRRRSSPGRPHRRPWRAERRGDPRTHPALRPVAAEGQGHRRPVAILIDEHGGVVPGDMEALERLPGVGHKTASVVMAQAFGVPAFPVDTHIHRLASAGACPGQERGADGAGPEAPVPARGLEPPAPADHLLRPRVLHRARLRRPRLRDLPHCYPDRKHPKKTRKA